MDPPRRPWTDPGFNKSQPSLAPRPERTTRTYPQPPDLIARRNNEEGATGGHRLTNAAGEGNDDNNNSSGNSSGNDIDINQSAVRASAAGTTEQDEQEEHVDGDGDADGDAHGDTDGDAGKGKGKGKGVERGQQDAVVADDRGDPCPICQDHLPEKERGILKCGHVFCFVCIHKWSKKETKCPACRRKFSTISKTLPLEEFRQELVLRLFRAEHMTKAQKKKAKRRSERYKKPKPFAATKTVRVRPRSQADEQRRLQANAPHPQAPGGFLHVPLRFVSAAAAVSPSRTPRYVSRWSSLVDTPPSPPYARAAQDDGEPHHIERRATAEGDHETRDPGPARSASPPVPGPPATTDPRPASWPS